MEVYPKGTVLGDIDIPIVILDSLIEPSSINYKPKKPAAPYGALVRHWFKWITYEER
jgi:hypothetical protein